MHNSSLRLHWSLAETRLLSLMPPDDVAPPPPRIPGSETGGRAPEAPAVVRPSADTARRVEGIGKQLADISVENRDPSVFTSGGGINRLWWQNRPGATQQHYKIMHDAHLSWEANIRRVQPRTPQQWEAFKAGEVARLNPQLAPHGLRVFSYPGIPALGWEVTNAGTAGIPSNLQGPLNDMMSPSLNSGPNINVMAGSRLTIIIAILIALLVLLKLSEEGKLEGKGRRRNDSRPDGDGTRPEAPGGSPSRNRVREEMRSKKLNLDGLKQSKEKQVQANTKAIEGHQREISSIRLEEDTLGARRKGLQEQVSKLQGQNVDPTNPELVRAKAELEQVDRNITSSKTRRETLEKDIKRREEENKVLQADVKIIDEMRAEGRDAVDRAVRLTNLMIERLPEAVRKSFCGYEVTVEGAIMLKEPSGELHRLLAASGQPPLVAGTTVQLSQIQEALDRMPRT